MPASTPRNSRAGRSAARLARSSPIARCKPPAGAPRPYDKQRSAHPGRLRALRACERCSAAWRARRAFICARAASVSPEGCARLPGRSRGRVPSIPDRLRPHRHDGRAKRRRSRTLRRAILPRRACFSTYTGATSVMSGKMRPAAKGIVQHHHIAGLHLAVHRSRRAPTSASIRDAPACDRPSRSLRPLPSNTAHE